MTIAFTGGGTGGHFYPIIAIVEALNDLVREDQLIAPKLYYCADILLVAVRNEFKQQGIFALMVEELLANLMKQGIIRAHAHWQMSGNKRIVNLWKRFDAQRHKRRVCFKKRLELEV